MPSSTLIPFFGGLGSLINLCKQRRGTLFNPRLLGNLGAKPSTGRTPSCSARLGSSGPEEVDPRALSVKKVKGLGFRV